MYSKRLKGEAGESLNPSDFPIFCSTSAAPILRRVPVYTGSVAPRLEFIGIDVGPRQGTDKPDLLLAIAKWNLQWEGGPYRAMNLNKLPRELAFLRALADRSRTTPPSDLVLVACSPDDVYQRWAPLYHLLPRGTLVRFGLPCITSGLWPLRAYSLDKRGLSTAQQPALERAFAQHLWAHGLGRAKSPLAAFSPGDSLRLISHDLNFWLPHMELLLREYNGTERVPRDAEDDLPESIESEADMRFELPRKGTTCWRGEADAAATTQDLIDMADERGNLRAVMDAIRSNRVEEDFSPRWSAEREDFERKLYGKRSGRVHVSFVEIGDSIPFHDTNAELHDGMVYRNLLSIVNVKDRQVVVCLHKGMTNAQEIADHLGYANHSPISKALKRIRRRAAQLLH